MIPPTSIDGTDITGATIDGTDVTEITVDGQTVFTAVPSLPTAGLLHHWDFSNPNSTTSFVEDQQGSADLTGSFAGFGTINGKQAGDFSTQQIFETSAIQAFSTNRLIAMVFKINNINFRNTLFDDDSVNDGVVLLNENGDYVFFQGGSTPRGGTVDTNPHIAVMQIDSTDTLRIDGSQIFSQSAGNHTMDTFRVGLERKVESELDGFVGEILMYNLSQANVADIENYLSNSWNITI